METEGLVVDRLIRIREVLHISGLSRSALYARIKNREFPAQVKLSARSSAWVRSEVVAWAAARAKLRNTDVKLG